MNIATFRKKNSLRRELSGAEPGPIPEMYIGAADATPRQHASGIIDPPHLQYQPRHINLHIYGVMGCIQVQNMKERQSIDGPCSWGEQK